MASAALFSRSLICGVGGGRAEARLILARHVGREVGLGGDGGSGGFGRLAERGDGLLRTQVAVEGEMAGQVLAALGLVGTQDRLDPGLGGGSAGGFAGLAAGRLALVARGGDGGLVGLGSDHVLVLCGCVEFGHERGHGVVKGADRVGQAIRHGFIGGEGQGLGRADRLVLQATVACHGGHEHVVEPVDAGLDPLLNGVREGLVGVAVDLVRAGMNEGDLETGILHRLGGIDMGRDDADRADPAGPRDPDPVGRRGDRVGGGVGGLVREGPHRLRAPGCVDHVDEVEVARNLAAGAVADEGDASDAIVGEAALERAAM